MIIQNFNIIIAYIRLVARQFTSPSMQANPKKQLASKPKKQPGSKSRPKSKGKPNSIQPLKSNSNTQNKVKVSGTIERSTSLNSQTNQSTKQQDPHLALKKFRSELDVAQQKLKNRDISSEQLKQIVSQSFLSSIMQIYKHHSSLWQQASRIIIQIYSHYPIRHLLYFNSSKHSISLIVIPLLIETHRSLNETAAVECMRGLFKQGRLDLLAVLKYSHFGDANTNEQVVDKEISQHQNQSTFLMSNMKQIVKKWSENVNSIFMAALLYQIYAKLQIFYNQRTSKAANKNQIETTNSSDRSAQQHVVLMKNITILITKYTTSDQVVSKKISQTVNQQTKQIIFSLFKLYIDNECQNVSIPITMQSKSEQDHYEISLPFLWAFHSNSSYTFVNSSNSKQVKQANIFKDLYAEVIAYIDHVIDTKESEKNQNNNIMYNGAETKKEYSNFIPNHISSFMYCMMCPFAFDNAQKFSHILSHNGCKLLVLVFHSQTILHLLSKVNVQGNFKEGQVMPVIHWIFSLALFCDQAKKKYKLEALLKQIHELGLASQQIVNFNHCQSILYRVLISVQKCLPRYSLKYYEDLYINRPGIFHLHFMDHILKQRQYTEVSKFLGLLVQKWVGVEMRDFNLLGYVCKFIYHYLIGSATLSPKDGHQTLLTFFKQLSSDAIIKLNIVFYQSSFSQLPSPLYTQQIAVNNNNSVGQNTAIGQNSNNLISIGNIQNLNQPPPPPTLSTGCPPISLSSVQQQSCIMSCGYGCSDKTIFLDRNFYIGQEILHWSIVLHQVYEDDFYYHCKYFYYLLTASYAWQPINKRQRVDTKDKGRLSLDPIRNNNNKINKIIDHWRQSISRNKVTQIQSIFQLFSCWCSSLQICNQHQVNQIGTTFNLNHAGQIIQILVQEQDKLLNLVNIYIQNWRQFLKQMQNNSDLFDSYRKEENKIRNRQLYFLRCVVRFFETLALKLPWLIPKTLSFEHVAQSIQKFAHYGGGLVCWRSLRVLSEKMSKNVFVQSGLTVLRHSHRGTIAKLIKKKLQLFREIVYAFVQQRVLTEEQQRNINSQNSYRSHCSENSQTRSIEQVSESQLKIKVSQIIQQTIQLIAEPITTDSKTDKTSNILRSEKEQLYNKILALQIIQEFFSSTNRKALRLVQNLFSKVSSKQKPGNDNLMQSLRHSIIAILFRDSSMITKYERKLITHIRSTCLKWIAAASCAQLRSNNTRILSLQQTMIVLWHFAIDEDVQLRVQCLSILTNLFKSTKYFSIQQQLYYVVAILTLISTLETKPKIKAYSDAMCLRLYKCMVNANNIQIASFALGVVLTIGFFIYNCKVSLPCFDVFQSLWSLWLKNSKDSELLIMASIEQIQRQGIRLKQVKFVSSKRGDDLKTYYMNPKSRRGWTHVKDKIQGVDQQKSEYILKQLKFSLVEKHKNVKFMKIKKQAVLDIEQLLNSELSILEYGQKKNLNDNSVIF